MKHAHKLRNLLDAALYCVEADNEIKMREIWDALKLAEQINALANVQFFDDWQTFEKAEFELYRANEVLSEYRDLADIISRNPIAKGLFYSSSQWRDLELHLMHEHVELIMCVGWKKGTIPPKPATESEQDTEPPTPAHDVQAATDELDTTGSAHVTQWLIDNFGKEQAEAFICAVNALSRTNKGLKKVIAERFAEMKYIDDGYVKLYGQKLAEELNNCVGDFLKTCNTKEYTRDDVYKYNKYGLFVNMDFYE